MNGRWGIAWLCGVPFRGGMSRRRMEGLTDRRLRWLVEHARRTMPFYRMLLENKGVEPGSIRGFSDLYRLPVVTKQALREAGESAWATDLAADKRILASTSGSSDQPLDLVFRLGDRLRKHAIGLHCMSTYGWRPWHRGMALGSEALPVRHPFSRLGISRWNWVDPTQPVRQWLDEFHRVRPQALHSYPSALREFCFEALAAGPLKWQPKVLSVGGEVYPEELTPLIREVFGRAPLVMYGAVEGGRLAFECHVRNGLHVRPDAVRLELLADGEPTAPGEAGSVHITSLINTAMPIIRYELGDLATWVPGDCECGSWWPRLKIQQGRAGDVIPLPDGRRIPVTRLAAIVGKSRAIRQFQFLRRGERLLVLRFEPTGNESDSVQALLERLREVLQGMMVEAEPHGQLPRTRSGKVTRYIDES